MAIGPTLRRSTRNKYWFHIIRKKMIKREGYFLDSKNESRQELWAARVSFHTAILQS